MKPLALRREGLFMRAFVWLWHDPPANFCLLFWGVLLSPIGLYVRFGAALGVLIGRGAKAAHLPTLVEKVESKHPRSGDFVMWGLVVVLACGLIALLVDWGLHDWISLVCTVGGLTVLGGLAWFVTGYELRWLSATYHTIKGHTCPRIEIR